MPKISPNKFILGGVGFTPPHWPPLAMNKLPLDEPPELPVGGGDPVLPDAGGDAMTGGEGEGDGLVVVTAAACWVPVEGGMTGGVAVTGGGELTTAGGEAGTTGGEVPARDCAGPCKECPSSAFYPRHICSLIRTH